MVRVKSRCPINVCGKEDRGEGEGREKSRKEGRMNGWTDGQKCPYRVCSPKTVIFNQHNAGQKKKVNHILNFKCSNSTFK